MYDLKQNGKYEKARYRPTRANDGYTFDTMRVNSNVYARSPYYKGAKEPSKLYQ